MKSRLVHSTVSWESDFFHLSRRASYRSPFAMLSQFPQSQLVCPQNLARTGLCLLQKVALNIFCVTSHKIDPRLFHISTYNFLSKVKTYQNFCGGQSAFVWFSLFVVLGTWSEIWACEWITSPKQECGKRIFWSLVLRIFLKTSQNLVFKRPKIFLHL